MILGAQHVLVMFTGMIGAPLALARSLDLPTGLASAMVCGCMLGCGVGTLLASLGRPPLGGRLPLVLGVFTVYLGPVNEIAHTSGLAAAATSLLVGSLLTLVGSPVLARARAFLPPVVLGAVLLVTGASLLRIGAGLLFNGSPGAVLLGLLTLTLILALSAVQGATRSLSISSALLVGYAMAVASGLVDFSPLMAAPAFAMPMPLPFGLAWPSLSAAAAVLVCGLAAAVETTVQAVAVAAICGVPAGPRRVAGALAADGAGSALSVLFGGLPLTSYSQNIAAITLTGVGSRAVIATCGAMLVILACLPQVSLAVVAIPAPILGGVLLYVFGLIATVGITSMGPLAAQRDRTIVAGSLALGLGTTFAGPSLAALLPPTVQPFVADGIVVGMLAAILLNLMLPPPES